MAASNLDVIRQGYDAFNRGDIASAVGQIDPEIVWHDASEVPGARMRRGVDEVRAFLESIHRIWDEPRFDPEELEAAGDTVIAMVRFSGRGSGSGAEVATELAHSFQFEGGRVRSVVTYFEREQARTVLEELRAASRAD